MRKKKYLAKRKEQAAQENICADYVRTATAKTFTGRKEKPKARKLRAKMDLSDTHVNYNEKKYLDSAKKYGKKRNQSEFVRNESGQIVEKCKSFS